MSSRALADPVQAARAQHEVAPADRFAAGAGQETPSDVRRVWYFQAALLLAVLTWASAWYWDTAASMVAIWWRSETFAHGLVVYPIALWLVWRRREVLARLVCRPSYIGLIFVGLATFGWLLGDAGGVQAARHLGFVAMIAASVWAVLGTAVARAIAFPLAFTLLAVPIGEFLLPMLMQYTADFTVGAIRLSGVPVYREGNDFVVPTGSWSVVEACSGLRYLIASITLGVLYAYLSFTSLTRRALFVLASILVPIVANWVRAYMIVMIGHLSGNKYAAGVDHLLYGWLFFGVVMLLLFWGGARWRQDVGSEEVKPMPARSDRSSLAPGLIVGAMLTAVVVAVAPMYSEALESKAGSGQVTINIPETFNGWRAVETAPVGFQARFIGARRLIERSFEKNGRVVALVLGYYANEHQGSELIGEKNGLFSSKRGGMRVLETKVTSADGDIENARTRLKAEGAEFLVLQRYWTADRWVVRPELVKLLQTVNKLLGRGDDAAIVITYSRADDGAAEAALRDFTLDVAPVMAEILSNARRTRLAAGKAAETSTGG